jgi:hypothetical protein
VAGGDPRTAARLLILVKVVRRRKGTMLDTIRKTWGWIVLDPVEVVAMNPFGNVIVRAADGIYWRICPEELSCRQIAQSADELKALLGDEEFQTDWEMAHLVELARQKLGPLAEGRCYCLKLPAVVGGSYDATNQRAIALEELIAFSGDIDEQIKDLPDGAQIEIKIIP